MNRNEILVMEELLKQNYLNPMTATTIHALSKTIGVSYFSVRNIVRGLLLAEYCGAGLKRGRSETYYLGIKGIEKIKEMKRWI